MDLGRKALDHLTHASELPAAVYWSVAVAVIGEGRPCSYRCRRRRVQGLIAKSTHAGLSIAALSPSTGRGPRSFFGEAIRLAGEGLSFPLEPPRFLSEDGIAD